MNATARLLDSITEWPQDPDLETRLKQISHSGKTIHNCYCGFGGIWQVKLFIGGEQRIIGETFNVLRAVRFADMALVYFAKYRTRRKRPIVDSDLNFSLRSALRDLDAVPQAKQILVSLEQALSLRGLISDSAVVSDVTVDNRPADLLAKQMAVHFRQFGVDVLRARALLHTNESQKITLDMLDENIRQTRIILAGIYSALSNNDGGLSTASSAALRASLKSNE